jgi:hypothetical protein
MRAKLNEKLTAAVDLALTGDWQGAHLVAQDHEGDELANWLHAVAHRMEGDLGNARYWYRRAHRVFPKDADARAEVAALASAFKDSTH